MNLNKVFLLGNLTRDPEVKALPSGKSVVNFGMATNRFYTDSSGEKQQNTQFHNIVAFGRLADISSRYLKKGSLTLIEGRLRTRSWEDSSGSTRYRTEVIARNIQLPPKSWGTAPSSQNQKPQQKFNQDIPVIEEDSDSSAKNKGNNSKPENKEKQSSKKTSKEKDSNKEEEIDIEDIPF